MKIGVTSDTHGSMRGWDLAWQLLKKTEAIIHCGDLFNHGPGNPVPEGYAPRKLLDVFNNLEIPMLPVKGNCDSEVDEKLLHLPISHPFLLWQIDGIRLAATHGHLYEDDDQRKDISKKWKLNIFVTGHTHVWRAAVGDETLLMNPGSPSIPRTEPSAAVIDTEKRRVEIFNLEDFSLLSAETIPVPTPRDS